MRKDKSAVRSLLEIQVGEPETAEVYVTRRALYIKLQELPYDRLVAIRGTSEAVLNYFIASVIEPNFKDPAWYKDHLGCPTPVEAVKKLLRPGEVRAIVHKCDILNGYGPGAVISVERDEQELQDMAVGKALEDLEKN